MRVSSLIRFIRDYPNWTEDQVKAHFILAHIFYNGRMNRMGRLSAFLDFFFPYRLRREEKVIRRGKEFRIFEKISSYIRCEATASINWERKISRHFYTFRNFAMFHMGIVRLRFFSWNIYYPYSFKRAFVAVALALCILMSHNAAHQTVFAAIGAVALDDADQTGFVSTGTSLTLSFTHTGTNGVMLVGLGDFSQNLNADATYNGDAMTDLYTHLTDYDRYSWYRFAPDTGTHNLTCGFSATLNAEMGCATYTGVDQGGFDATSTGELTGTGNKNFTVDTTVDNCWVHGIILSTGALGGITTGTERWNNSDSTCAGDTNGVVSPAGTATIGANQTAGGTRYTNGDLVSMQPFVVSFKPKALIY